MALTQRLDHLVDDSALLVLVPLRWLAVATTACGLCLMTHSSLVSGFTPLHADITELDLEHLRRHLNSLDQECL